MMSMDFLTAKFTQAFNLKGSVIKHVAPKVAFFFGWSLLIFVLDLYAFNPGSLRFESTLITLLGLVISLLLVFRTNTAYSHYWEGRRLWSELSVALRAISRTIWIHVDEKDGKYSPEIKSQVIHLLIAYAYACKHHLRGEYGVDHPELSFYLSHVPDITESSHCLLEVAQNTKITATFPEGGFFHLPLLISHHISCFVGETLSHGAIPTPVATALFANINSLISSLTGFERILSTPIPTAYSVHLSQTIWLFCLFLPFQVLNMFKSNEWVMIVIVSLASFTIFGIINIGEEIENPFGLDANDLPLNEYCAILKKEIQAMIGKNPPKVENWVCCVKNKLPLTPPQAHTTVKFNPI